MSMITKSTGNARSMTFTNTSSTKSCALIIDLFANRSSILLEIVTLPMLYFSARDKGITLMLKPRSINASSMLIPFMVQRM
ncbi:hypothetical protein A2U01_0078351, partial [Trifolium medium]|nr:hypothetical protein [Trifolium medium]